MIRFYFPALSVPSIKGLSWLAVEVMLKRPSGVTPSQAQPLPKRCSADFVKASASAAPNALIITHNHVSDTVLALQKWLPSHLLEPLHATEAIVDQRPKLCTRLRGHSGARQVHLDTSKLLARLLGARHPEERVVVMSTSKQRPRLLGSDRCTSVVSERRRLLGGLLELRKLHHATCFSLPLQLCVQARHVGRMMLPGFRLRLETFSRRP